MLDLCCGSGAVGAVIAARVADIRLVASDVAPAAVRCARCNLAGFGAQTREGDLYAPLPAALAGRVDVLVVNAPYVPTGEIERLPREARLYEPRGTYDGGSDGHDIQRRVAADAVRWLAAGGHLLIETGEHQAAETADMVRRAGLRATVARSDDLDATVVIGTRR